MEPQNSLPHIHNFNIKTEKDFLHDQNQFLVAVFESTLNPMFILDSDARIFDLNKSALGMFGQSKEELLGLRSGDAFRCVNSFGELGCGGEIACNNCDLRSSVEKTFLRKSPVENFEGKLKVFVRGKNVTRNFLISTAPIRVEGNFYALLNLVDITKSKANEEKLIELLNAVEHSPVSIMITDHQGTIEYVNPKFTETSGYEKHEAIGMNSNLMNSGMHSSRFFDNLWNQLESTGNWVGRICNKKKDGKLIWESVNISSVRGENGMPVKFVAVKEDITEKLEWEKELFKYQNELESLVKERTKQLENLNEKLNAEIDKTQRVSYDITRALESQIELDTLKENFISMSSHKLRTPLTAIQSSTELLEQYILKNNQSKAGNHIQIIQDEINKLESLIKALSSLNIQKNEELSFQQKEFNLDMLIEQLLEDNHISQKDFNSMLKFEINCPAFSFLINKNILRAILAEVLSNAIKFSDGDRVIIKIELIDETLKFTIRDKGKGISQTHIENVFEPFYKGDYFGHPGPGMGLTVAKSFIHKISGSIKIESEVEKGTTVEIQIPLLKLF